MNRYLRHFFSFLLVGIVFLASASLVSAQTSTILDCKTACTNPQGCVCNTTCDGETIASYEPFYFGTCREQLTKQQAGGAAFDQSLSGNSVNSFEGNRGNGSERNSGDSTHQTGANTASSVFGTVEPPQGVSQFSSGSDIGLLNFISVLVRIFTVVMGIVVFFNFIYSGYTYITSDGNSKAADTVRTRLTYSIIGLVLIVSSYMIIALISLIIFGDASYILNPTITPPGVTQSGTP